MESILIHTEDRSEFELILEAASGNRRSRHAVVMTHGIFTDRNEKGRFTRLANRLCDHGFDVGRFDFRGHGERSSSLPVFSVTSAITDYLAAIRKIRSLEYATVSIVGSSFGASICLLERLLPIQQDIAAFAFLNPVTDYHRNLLASRLEWATDIFSEERIRAITAGQVIEIQPGFHCGAAFLAELSSLQPFAGIRRLNAPTLVLHGDADDKIEVGTTTTYFSSSENTTLEVVGGAGHAFKDAWAEQHAHGTVTSWLARVVFNASSAR